MSNNKKRKAEQVFNINGFAEIEGRSNKRQRFVQQRLDQGELKIILPDQDNSSNMHGDLFVKLKQEKKLEHMTNFNEAQLRDLWLGVSKFVTALKKRGPPPSISYLDSLVILLMLYKTGDDMTYLATSLGVAYTTLRDAVLRIRPLLHAALVERWWEKRRRPVLGDGEDANIALLVDSNSQNIYRPRGSFDEAKILFDAKNCIYAWKKEVAVTAVAPHYALFVSPKFAGSTHDYEIHKSNYKIYAPYLLKTPEERQQHRPNITTRWSLLGDSAYIGPESDTPEISRVYIERYSQTDNPARNTRLAKLRVPIEQFFGRMEKAWYLTAFIYTFDHQYFDTDYENCVLLTNELIKHRNLDEQDYRYHWALYSKRVEIYLEEVKKRREAYGKSSENRRRRWSLTTIGDRDEFLYHQQLVSNNTNNNI